MKTTQQSDDTSAAIKSFVATDERSPTAAEQNCFQNKAESEHATRYFRTRRSQFIIVDEEWW